MAREKAVGWEKKHSNVDKVVKTSNKILDRATHLLEDWKLANTKKEKCNDVMSNGKNSNVIHRVQQCRNYHMVQSWLCPPTERYKYNTDASLSSPYNREGHIMCIHDDEEGLCLQKKCDFEFDSKKVVDYFYKGSNGFTKFGTVMVGCNLFLENSHVEFSRSKTNEVVHVLTKVVTSLYISLIFLLMYHHVLTI
ncbi:transmembrane protein, putative [Medicago truncatula]|uniref:Transmembrane protein, putative n=1 Tax=Medicago truncatula TaxID=3880 RepID=G7IC08_MEDTR|nr:transmembrane protein, putative [Medicago truncatula]